MKALLCAVHPIRSFRSDLGSQEKASKTWYTFYTFSFGVLTFVLRRSKWEERPVDHVLFLQFTVQQKTGALFSVVNSADFHNFASDDEVNKKNPSAKR